MKDDFTKRLKAALRGAPDMRAAEPARDYVPPAAGIAHARLIGYFELGKHTEKNMKDQDVDREKVDLVFELSGPNHPAREFEGVKIPQRITVRETKSLSEEADFFKLFGSMNYAGKGRHMAQLLGQSFLVEIFHKESKGKVCANLKGPHGYNVTGPFYQDPLTGKTRKIDVDPAMTELRFFIWDTADEEMWDSIYIEGTFEERRDAEGRVISPARSKNVFQETIKSAVNWQDHPLSGRLLRTSQRP